jgi:DNA-binding response OmpR family regulator
MRCLVIEDERKVADFVARGLRAERFAVDVAYDGPSGWEMASLYDYDLIILDLMLPGLGGTEILRRLRRAKKEAPVLILTARDSTEQKVENFEAGADDYLTKPFGVGELLARMRVVLRRAAPGAQDGVYQVKDLLVDLTRRLVTAAGKEVSLTPTEFDLLRVLIQNAGKVMTHRQLIHKVWGTAYEDESRLLRVNISNLRRKIEPDPDQPCYIVTELGVGYRLRDI